MLNTLRAAGMSTKDVKLSFLQPADAYGAFTQRKIDAWAVWDPYTSQARLESNARVLTDGTGAGLPRPHPPAGGRGVGPPPTNGYSFQVAGTSALADAGRNSAVRDYLVRHAKAEIWADAHREEWARVWAAATGLKLEVAREAVPNYLDLPTPLDDAVIRSQQELADAFVADKVLPNKIDFARFVDRRFTAELDATRG